MLGRINWHPNRRDLRYFAVTLTIVVALFALILLIGGKYQTAGEVLFLMRFCSTTNGLQIAGQQLKLIRFKFGFLPHFLHPLVPFCLIIRCWIVKLMALGAFGDVQLSRVLGFFGGQFRRSNWKERRGKTSD